MFEFFPHPPPLVVLAVIFAIAWIVLRWGVAIFMLYALWHFALGEWTAAGLALGFAFALQALKAPIDAYDALVSRDGW